MTAASAQGNLQLQALNPLITCKVCGGYFVDATTITECLHTCTYSKRGFRFFLRLYVSSVHVFNKLPLSLLQFAGPAS